MRLSDEEVANEVHRLEQELGSNYKVVNLSRPLDEIEAELDEDDREFVRYVKERGPAQIAVIQVASFEFCKP
jgi:hypothetical protein